jgi:hypothetical protein
MIRVTHGIDDLANDLRHIATTSPLDMRRVVAENIREGNQIAKGYARQSAGAHGKHYHKAFSTEMTGPTTGEYGPDASMPQGGMSFERGSRNQKPHLDLARSADVIGPKFAAAVHDLPDDWFWPA